MTAFCLQMVDRLIQELVTEGSAILSRWLDGANQVRGLIHVASEHNTQLATQQARMASMLAAETATLPKVPTHMSRPQHSWAQDNPDRGLKHPQALRKRPSNASMGICQVQETKLPLPVTLLPFVWRHSWKIQ